VANRQLESRPNDATRLQQRSMGGIELQDLPFARRLGKAQTNRIQSGEGPSYPTSGIIRHRPGEMAEWLKAAVC